jgi:hypothetical protein
MPLEIYTKHDSKQPYNTIATCTQERISRSRYITGKASSRKPSNIDNRLKLAIENSAFVCNSSSCNDVFLASINVFQKFRSENTARFSALEYPISIPIDVLDQLGCIQIPQLQLLVHAVASTEDLFSTEI